MSLRPGLPEDFVVEMLDGLAMVVNLGPESFGHYIAAALEPSCRLLEVLSPTIWATSLARHSPRHGLSGKWSCAARPIHAYDHAAGGIHSGHVRRRDGPVGRQPPVPDVSAPSRES